MAINPTPETVGSLFGNKKYEVDFYQREYKWNDNLPHKPIRSLLDDLFYRFDLNYKPSVDVTEQEIAKYDWYYLNSYMTNTVKGSTYIVDGQQRLTTLTILTVCLWQIGKKLCVNTNKLDFLKKKICDVDAMGNHVFWMGFADREKAFNTIFNLQPAEFVSATKSSSTAEKNIFDAHKVIYNYLENRLVTEHIYDAFRLYLYTRVMDNVTVRTDPAGNIKADKEKSTEKIDGAIATIMALDRAIRHEGSGGSVYDERGLLIL